MKPRPKAYFRLDLTLQRLHDVTKSTSSSIHQAQSVLRYDLLATLASDKPVIVLCPLNRPASPLAVFADDSFVEEALASTFYMFEDNPRFDWRPEGIFSASFSHE